MEDLKVLNNPDLKEQKVIVNINPDTGMEDISGSYNEEDYEDLESSYNDLTESIDSIDIDDENVFENTPVTGEEIKDTVIESNSSLINEINDGDIKISTDTAKELLDLVNRKIKGEKINPYKEMPEQIRNIIDKYIKKNTVNYNQAVNLNIIRKNVADALLDDFINDIQLKRMKNDFATDLENLYKDSIKDIAAGTLQYIDERNKAYREAANDIQDEEKRKKMLAILDQIDEARSLTQLKEYAKHCRIKSIELEKPDNRVYSSFLYKYKNSNNNIYDIALAKKVLFRHLSNLGYSIRDIDAFFVCFCKQVKNYVPTKPVDHAYMYYVLYYCALLDGDNSMVFVNNVKEVIDNLRERNSLLKK